LYGGAIRKRATLVLAQRRVAQAGIIAPDRVVFEEDPAHAAALLKDPAYSSSASGALLRTPPGLQSYRAARLRSTRANVAPIFAGQRTDPAGKPMIVDLYADLGQGPGPRVDLYIAYSCDELASMLPWKAAPVPLGGAQTKGSMALADDLRRLQLHVHRSLTLYAATPDPNNSRRFTSRYAIDGESGTLEFLVRQVGSIQINVLDGPLSREKLDEFATKLSR
jgi:hypothetical protein